MYCVNGVQIDDVAQVACQELLIGFGANHAVHLFQKAFEMFIELHFAFGITIVFLCVGKTGEPFRGCEKCICDRYDGWLPELFRKIVRTAKELLQGMIREKAMPPKPVLNMDIAEFRKMQQLMIKVQNKAKHIRQMQETDLPRLKAQLADIKGIFKGKERKALEQEIQKLEQAIREELNALPTILEEDGYPDVQAFTATYRKAEKVVSQYNRDLAQWERMVQEKKQPAEKPPGKQSVREQLRRLQEEGRKKPRNRSWDHER